jgi:hypothetical protein
MIVLEFRQFTLIILIPLYDDLSGTINQFLLNLCLLLAYGHVFMIQQALSFVL